MTQTNKMQVRLQQIESPDSGKKYYLVVRKLDNIAVDCQCGNRQYRGRKLHKPCKHMRRWNSQQACLRVAAWMSGFAGLLQEATKYDVVGEALLVVNQAMADQVIADTYEVLALSKQGHSCGLCGARCKHDFCATCIG